MREFYTLRQPSKATAGGFGVFFNRSKPLSHVHVLRGISPSMDVSAAQRAMRLKNMPDPPAI